MKRLLCLLLALCLPLGALAEEAPGYIGDNQYRDDSLYVWIDRVERDDSVYYVAHVNILKPEQLATALSADANQTLADIAEASGFVVAINGETYKRVQRGWIIRGGEVLRKDSQGKHDLLLIDAAGDFHAVRLPNKASIAAALAANDVRECFAQGPVLVQDGIRQYVYKSAGGSKVRAARTAIGQIGPLYYVLVVVEGKTEASKGVTHRQLSKFMLDLQCKTAYALDSGANSALWFGGRIVNQPSDGALPAADDAIGFRTLAGAE